MCTPPPPPRGASVSPAVKRGGLRRLPEPLPAPQSTKVWARAGEEVPAGHWQQRVSVQREGHRCQGKRGVTDGRRKDNCWPWRIPLSNTSSHTLSVSYSHFTDEDMEAQEIKGLAQEPSNWGRAEPATDPGLCGHISGSPSCPSPNCSCPDTVIYFPHFTNNTRSLHRLFGKGRKVRRKYKVQDHNLPCIVPPPHPHTTYC